MTEKINIAFVTDNNYFRHMPIVVESILDSSKESDIFRFYIIDVGINKENIDFLISRYSSYNIEFKFISLSKEKLIQYKIKTHLSAAAYAKVFLSELVNEERVIYLDVDLLVLSNIGELWNEFDENVSLKAVWNPFYNYDNKFWGESEDTLTFNSGVMLLNLKKMRKDGSAEKLRGFLNDYHDKTHLHDQAAFNAIFNKEWVALPLKWNVQVSMLQNTYTRLLLSRKKYKEYIETPSIIHFTSNSKPWQIRNAHPYKKSYQKLHKEVYLTQRKDDTGIKAIIQKIWELSRYKYFHYRNKF